ADADDLDDREVVLRCCHDEGPFRSIRPPCPVFRPCRRGVPDLCALAGRARAGSGARPVTLNPHPQLEAYSYVNLRTDTDSRAALRPGSTNLPPSPPACRAGGGFALVGRGEPRTAGSCTPPLTSRLRNRSLRAGPSSPADRSSVPHRTAGIAATHARDPNGARTPFSGSLMLDPRTPRLGRPVRRARPTGPAHRPHVQSSRSLGLEHLGRADVGDADGP